MRNIRTSRVLINVLTALVIMAVVNSAAQSATNESESSSRSLVTILGYLLFDESLPYDISMNLPYRDEADIDAIAEAYSEEGSEIPPWCPEPPDCPHPHDGIDFMPERNLIPIQSVSHGDVDYVGKYGDRGQVTVIVRYNETYAVNYAFEPGNADASDEQLASIAVKKGQKVVPGQLIGRLVKPSPDNGGAHLHFGLIIDHIQDCPESYFTSLARISVLKILRERYPGAAMCYLAD